MAAGDGNTGNSDFEAGLQRLFADDRLSIRPAPVAGRAVVAGARRARRRREIALVGGGSAAVALVLVAVVMLAGLPQDGDGHSVAAPQRTSVLPPGQQPSMLPPPAATESKPPPSAEPAPKPGGKPGELDPFGYGELKLGMSFYDMKTRGLLGNPEARPPKGCESHYPAEGERDIRGLTISLDRDLVQVIAETRVRTPEGIGAGSSLRDVKSTYPKLSVEQGGDELRVDTGEGSYYRLLLDDDGSVGTLGLLSAKYDCGAIP